MSNDSTSTNIINSDNYVPIGIHMIDVDSLKQKIEEQKKEDDDQQKKKFFGVISLKFANMNIAELEDSYLNIIKPLLDIIGDISIKAFVSFSSFESRYNALIQVPFLSFDGEEIKAYLTDCSIFINDCYLNIVKQFDTQFNDPIPFSEMKTISKSDIYTILVIYEKMIKMYVYIYDIKDDDIHDNEKYIRLGFHSFINVSYLTNLYKEVDDSTKVRVFFSSKGDYSACRDGSNIYMLPFRYDRTIVNHSDSRFNLNQRIFMCLIF
jgi:hypothetical protein